MEIKLYTCSADSRIIDKTAYLSNELIVNGVLKEYTSLQQPEIRIRLETSGNIQYNYCYVFNTYFYIENWVNSGLNIFDITLSKDLLMTYKSELANCECISERTSSMDLEEPFVEDPDIEFNNNATELITKLIPIDGTARYTFKSLDNDIEWFRRSTVILLKDGSPVKRDGQQEINPEPTIEPPASIQDIVGDMGLIVTTNYGGDGFPVVMYDGDWTYFNNRITTEANEHIASVVRLPFNLQGDYLAKDWKPSIYNMTIPGMSEGVPGREFKGYTIPGNGHDWYCIGDYDIPAPTTYLDMEPYSIYELYIPGYGWKEYSIRQIEGKLNITYLLDLPNAKSSVMITNVSKKIVIDFFEVQIVEQLPVAYSNIDDIARQKNSILLNMILGTISGAGNAGISIATGNPLGMIFAGQSMIKSLTDIGSGIGKMATLRATQSGRVGCGIYSFYNPHDILLKKVSKPVLKSAKYGHVYVNTGQFLNSVNYPKCYFKMRDAILNGMTATNEEKSQILELLKTGVWTS